MALIEYCLIAYLRFDVCDVFISALELSSFILGLACNLSFVFTSNPQRSVRLPLVGEYVPIFPSGFLGFRIRR